jgi:hypothetical protein
VFLRAASALGVSPANAMRIAEYLYVNGFISYPRTDNTVYPATLDTKGIMASFLNTEFHEYAQKLLTGNLTPTRGKKETTRQYTRQLLLNEANSGKMSGKYSKLSSAVSLRRLQVKQSGRPWQ